MLARVSRALADGIMTGNNDEVYDKKPRRYAEDNVTQW